MRTDPTAPADTVMMGIVHGALRRDLERTRVLLDAGPLPADRRRALAEHLVWMMRFLHEHHEGEDTGLYPMVLGKDPALAALLEAMDAEHVAIHPAMAELTAAATLWADEPAAQPRVERALTDLHAVLDPHLRHEEEEMMPAVSRVLTAKEWDDWDQVTNVKPKKATQLAFEGHWLIDGANDEDRTTVVQLVPPVPRFCLVHLMGGPYARRRRALWDGTPAAAVPLLTLAELDLGG